MKKSEKISKFFLYTGPMQPEDSDPRYLISFYDEVFCCLPQSIRKVLRCGYNFKREKYVYRWLQAGWGS
ncbi:hypothetical protein CHS0354_015189 [Potamilus streckersoni]|uniref:Uncharacterized protein n=1 Tax=Potamilus streckersoni TaxID=2493646 RepID=A0AAE0SDH9_9BIVA|nr:hypothetical protein CHS0354_015189 [Potamilus streckersoni]